MRDEDPTGSLGESLQSPVGPHLASGQQIGRYTIRQVLGSGGFGVVYQAEQTEPVRRMVALKVLKPGMDSRAVLARFEAERQALALMNHPCIAKVLDGGMTEQGRPYFVMELVSGLPITDYCDRHRIPVKERLMLFAEVCDAIQHAHSKAVIHRDIKPSNILVTAGDKGVPTPKVIDFGVAKAVGYRLSDATIMTELGQMIGTPEYMSPEQADLTTEDMTCPPHPGPTRMRHARFDRSQPDPLWVQTSPTQSLHISHNSLEWPFLWYPLAMAWKRSRVRLTSPPLTIARCGSPRGVCCFRG